MDLNNVLNFVVEDWRRGELGAINDTLRGLGPRTFEVPARGGETTIRGVLQVASHNAFMTMGPMCHRITVATHFLRVHGIWILRGDGGSGVHVPGGSGYGSPISHHTTLHHTNTTPLDLPPST
ncbi:hypothetical protein GCK72_012543 [Caenorhabditis remanei]|uniref:Uncharacterized protein n=1 Tax=Caenorhabditis remanei TaxID=31234 RepID=A0A6A5GLB5_CAERE|nr:hypothetical protein GCK72_012543 [Caenorhabditis remanei]KAF1756090.1 hypothetical protein GCK72_012543 [Caenorhabditis remanei]